MAMKLAARVRLVKTRTGSSGCSTRLSITAKSDKEGDAGHQAGDVPVSLQPSVPARLMP